MMERLLFGTCQPGVLQGIVGTDPAGLSQASFLVLIAAYYRVVAAMMEGVHLRCKKRSVIGMVPRGLAGGVNYLAFSPDGFMLASGARIRSYLMGYRKKK